MARAGRKRGQPTDAAAARVAIVDATIACLAEVGFSATSARAVGERAGVAPGGVFYHFGSMDGLLVATFERCTDERLARLAEVFDRPTEQIPAALAAAGRHEFTRPESRALLEIVVGALGSPDLSEPVRRGVDRSVSFTQDAIRTTLASSPLAALFPVDVLAEIATSAFFGLEMLSHLGHDVDHDALASVVDRVAALVTPVRPTPTTD